MLTVDVHEETMVMVCLLYHTSVVYIALPQSVMGSVMIQCLQLKFFHKHFMYYGGDWRTYSSTKYLSVELIHKLE